MRIKTKRDKTEYLSECERLGSEMPELAEALMSSLEAIASESSHEELERNAYELYRVVGDLWYNATCAAACEREEIEDETGADER